ncbi:hypothetical protein L544_2327 [Bordetella hinzii OH87 BAL007II]|uniref:Uncharacterized protein n=1 Tax=Bordetella hinzii OH87 BAL007II TaxID=1331262 RepID=A0ABR4QW89_9BORD|nr:hypothetical protein L544_2327 [Bordetella hinzii OH87 BAL007II]
MRACKAWIRSLGRVGIKKYAPKKQMIYVETKKKHMFYPFWGNR